MAFKAPKHVAVANNLFVVVDLGDAARERAVLDAVAGLGEAVRVSGSTFYVRSELSTTAAATQICSLMDSADQLLVLNTSRDEAATFNVRDDVLQTLLRQWHSEGEMALQAGTSAVPGRL